MNLLSLTSREQRLARRLNRPLKSPERRAIEHELRTAYQVTSITEAVRLAMQGYPPVIRF